MLKSLTAVMAAAAIAAAITLLSAPATQVDAGPVAKPVESRDDQMRQAPWPYLRCVGTEFGNQRVRLVTAERLAQ